jgi:hypothetical protein
VCPKAGSGIKSYIEKKASGILKYFIYENN